MYIPANLVYKHRRITYISQISMLRQLTENMSPGEIFENEWECSESLTGFIAIHVHRRPSALHVTQDLSSALEIAVQLRLIA